MKDVTWRDPGSFLFQNREERKRAMSKNIIAPVIIAAVLAAGAIAIYHLNTGQGDRTTKIVSARSASD
jgi:hypothetical protein